MLMLATPFGVSAQALGVEEDVAAALTVTTAGSQGNPRVVFDGSQFVVLSDDRTVDAETSTVLSRVSASGVSTDLEIGLPYGARPVCAAGHCVATWSTYDYSAPAGPWPETVHAARFEPDGTVLDVPALVLFTEDGVTTTSGGQVVAMGVDFAFFTVLTDGAGTRLVMRRIGAAGLGPVVPVTAAAGTNDLAIGCTATACLFAWRETDGSVHYTLTDLGTVPTGATGTVTTTAGLGVEDVDVEPVGSGWALVESRRVGITTTRQTGWRIAADGTAGPPIMLGTGTAALGSLVCAENGVCLAGNASGVTHWPATGGSTATRALTGPRACGVASCAFVTQPTIADLTGEILELLPTTFGARTPFEVGTGADVLHGPLGIAGSIALFQRDRVGGSDLTAVRLEADGTPSGVPGIVVMPRLATDLDVVVAGAEHGLLTRSSIGVQFRRLDADGTVVGTTTDLGTGTRVSLAWNGTVYLAAWIDASNRISTIRLDAIGQRVDAVARILRPEATADVAVAPAPGGGWLVVAASTAGVRAYRVAPDGTSTETATGGLLVRDGVSVTQLHLARGRVGWIVGWLERVASGPLRPRVARLDDAVASLDVGGRSISAVESTDIAVAPLGAGWVVTWATASDTMADRARTVEIATVEGSSTGAVLRLHDDAGGVDRSYSSPSGVAIGGVPLVALYGGFVTARSRAPDRVMVRTVATRLGSTCDVAADCAAGLCVDGVCCESACADGCGECDATGACVPIAGGTMCRAAMGSCDVAEVCDGFATSCPAPVDIACDAGVMTADVGVPAIDGGYLDAGSVDLDGGIAGDASAPPSDAEVSDAATVDSGMAELDGGSRLDAGRTSDGGVSSADASGGIDVGIGVDAGSSMPPPPTMGCACAASRRDGNAPWAPLLLLAATVLGTRRRRETRRDARE